ncbi:hypothetical protein FPZ49_28165 [Paenibacillus cremeus]|uniref:Uncharacterized protein n=1 Tax=Paenibacillus cremeus TaxID=2163881 RepID=A0A559K379_9BACL|nr:hypothetical protein FPZ49_28165 [Paenibacillus cremeus]
MDHIIHLDRSYRERNGKGYPAAEQMCCAQIVFTAPGCTSVKLGLDNSQPALLKKPIVLSENPSFRVLSRSSL